FFSPRAASPVLYTLSLHDALPISARAAGPARNRLYTSGGTIPDRGYYNLRVAESRAKIGELDEEFVWERRLGESFTLGTQSWKIDRKSTRLNSSHVKISYAVFCLK